MNKNTLGELIKNAREKKGMSQRELSRQSGIDNNTIAKLEKGERKKPNIFALKKIAYILDIDLKNILSAAGYENEDIEFELYTLGNNTPVISKDGKLIPLKRYLQTEEEELITRKAICELIDSCNIDELKIIKELTDNKEIIEKGFELYKKETKAFEKKIKNKKDVKDILKNVKVTIVDNNKGSYDPNE